MGGGGMMRAAAKLAGFGIHSGIRSVPLPDHSFATAARSAARTIITSPTSESGKAAKALHFSQTGKNDGFTNVEKLGAWDVDDWEFASQDGDEVPSLDEFSPPPRLVFGDAPSLDEAKEATSDLKSALEKIYFKDNASGSENSSTMVKSSSQYSETKACVTVENVNPVLRAFSLLKENPATQMVVASCVSDKNVWNAVMQNEKVMEFMEQQHSSSPSQCSPEYSESDYDDKSSRNMFKLFFEEVKVRISKVFTQEIKARVVKMISDFSGFFENIFGGSSAGNGVAVDHVDKTLGASIMGLAVLAIMVVILKRSV